MSDRPVPIPDRDSKPWWEAVARHELIQQRCTSCGRWRWPPRALCSECGSFESEWARATGTGTVVSFIRTHHSFLPTMPAPFYTVFVAVDEQRDIIMPGSWHAESPPAIDMQVQVFYDDIATDNGTVALVGWQPVE
jgi:uncharacterized OB-fold protein